MARVAVSKALMCIADRRVQVIREIRASRIDDGPTQVHRWSLAKTIKRSWKAA
jgi:acyl-CoA dehydrogenase